ncbi:hypothetical protein IQ07DRAFT_638853 [Pyrenochaeta sp. DS3sAY3a]|nr:hypothetical protein IQ07DRAFT_638853 [Pyrenochaeta sp. DS3sAY3a]
MPTAAGKWTRSLDPNTYIITSFGKKNFRLKTVKRHTNPVFDEKHVFQALHHESDYHVLFTIMGEDKFTNNHYIGSAQLLLAGPISVAPKVDSLTGLYHTGTPGDTSLEDGITAFAIDSTGIDLL